MLELTLFAKGSTMPTFMGPAEGTVANGECCECGEGTPGNCLFCDPDSGDSSESPDIGVSGVTGNYCCDLLNNISNLTFVSGCNYEWGDGDTSCAVDVKVQSSPAIYPVIQAVLRMMNDPESESCESFQAYEGTAPDPCICEDGPLTIVLSKDGAPGMVGDCECDFPDTITISVAPNNARQQIARFGTVLSGTGTLTFDGQTTGTITSVATAAQVQTALEGLSNIAPGDVAVTGGPLGTAAIDVEFTGALAGRNVPLMTADTSGFSCAGACGITITEITKGIPYCYP